jgi:dienelactone hydrolase
MKMGISRRAAIAVAGTLVASSAISGEAIAGVARSAVLAEHTTHARPIPCLAQGDGVRVCHGDGKGPTGDDLRVKSFDGTPLALYVTLPPPPSTGTDGNYPLVILSHGWGDPTSGPDDPQYGGPTARQWAKEGYAVLQLVARGWGNSCGSVPSRFLDPAGCQNAYIHLVDFRYEVRDAQYVAGLLVDEGVADPNRIGVQGESYGGGTSLALATLNDRVMNADGTLSPWTSAGGIPLHVAAAAPFAGWSGESALAPNGRWLDSQKSAPTPAVPFGVQKMSISRGLIVVGAGGAYFPPPGADPDVLLGFAVTTAGEPYDKPLALSMVEQEARFRSSYHLLAGTFGTSKRAPAPLFFGQGFTDDVFEADQVLVYYNLLRSLYPTVPVEVLLGDIGHQRAQDKPADLALMRARIRAFFAHYVKGTGPQPKLGVSVLTQTCPTSAASDGPYTAPSWAALHPGVVNFSSGPTQTILSTSGDPTVSKAFDPVYGGRSCTTASAAPEGAGVATYRLPSPTGSGYTLLGSPMVTADLQVSGEFAYIAARLLDVDPVKNTETLVSRGAYRIDPGAPNGRQTFQISANGWHFASGHVPELELLGRDAPFLRPSNGRFSIAVSNLTLRLPVHEVPGARGTPPEVTRPPAAAVSN